MVKNIHRMVRFGWLLFSHLESQNSVSHGRHGGFHWPSDLDSFLMCPGNLEKSGVIKVHVFSDCWKVLAM